MAKVLDMPKLSPTMEEGVLATWHIKEGDNVAVDDLLAEVETDKATMEFRAFDKGTILKLLVEAGANVKLGQPVAILGNPGEDFSSLLSGSSGGGGGGEKEDAPAETPRSPRSEGKSGQKDDAKGEKQDAKGDKDDAKEAKTESGEHGAKGDNGEGAEETKTRARAPDTMRPAAPLPPPPAPPAPKKNILSRTADDPGAARGAAASAGTSANGGTVLASPHVRRIARERGIDLASARGTGEHGRIVPEDLDAIGSGSAKTNGGAAKAGETPAQGSAPLARASTALAKTGLAEPEVRPLSQMRKAIARRLTQSKQTVPHFYLTIDVDAEELVLLREKINAELKAGVAPAKPGVEAPKPEKISLNDLIIKACAVALVRVPECNAQFTEEAILVHKRVDISVAVAVPEGLLTPVVRNADTKSVVGIGREVRELASRARSKKLKPEEMSEGTFSISNLGMFGIDAFSAVINPPEGAILAVGQVREEPVVKNGEVEPGKRLSMTLSCDHRVVDGAVGASFLAELRDLIERPMRILTG